MRIAEWVRHAERDLVHARRGVTSRRGTTIDHEMRIEGTVGTPPDTVEEIVALDAAPDARGPRRRVFPEIAIESVGETTGQSGAAEMDAVNTGAKRPETALRESSRLRILRILRMRSTSRVPTLKYLES